MKAYKLFRKMRNGDIKSLFIDKSVALPKDVWLEAQCHPTKGFAVRKGWHCCSEQNAPHLTENGRVWCLVEIEDYTEFQRPEAQGGMWLLANRMKILEELT